MTAWWDRFVQFVTSPYLRLWWVLLVVYLPLYGLARAWAGTSRAGTTIVFRCRQGLAIAFALHLLVTVGVLIYWWQTYSASKAFGLYLFCYCLLILVDLVGVVSPLLGNERFRTFARPATKHA